MDGLYEQIRIAIHQVWRRRWLALAVAWAICVLGWLAIALIPNTYESKARVFVQMQSILPNQVGITVQEREGDLNRVKQTLTSSENLAKVVRRTDLNSLVASDRDLAVQVARIRESIKVTAQPDNMFEISATAKVSGFSNRQNAKLSAAVVQGLLDIFVEQNLAGDRDEANQSLAFLDQQLKAREAQLQEAEQRRVDFEQRFLGLLPGEGSIGARMSAARTELASIDQQLMQAQSSLAALRGQLAATPPSMPALGGDSGGGGARGQIAALEAQLAQSTARGWTDSHPDVVALKNQIARLRPLAAREPAGAGTMPNPSYVSLRAMVGEKEGLVNAAATRKAQLQSDLAQLGTRQASEPGVAADQERLNRDYDVLKRQYDKLLEDRDQVRLRTDVRSQTDAVKFKVIDPPSQPSVPLTPNRPLLLTLILLVGLGVGCGTAYVLGQIQTTFPTQSRLADATGLPVLGSIGQVFTDEARAKRRQRLLWLGGGAGALGVAWAVLLAVEFWQRSTVA
ncbi:MAG: protein tyrosine kinase modulator [Sphingomonadales bacterium]|jgi:polysaccharide chain length determinant protein (PEP-CTERM system associated)|nr:protein tyrosine kinase modulator [Sphingomonadales bacterium]